MKFSMKSVIKNRTPKQDQYVNQYCGCSRQNGKRMVSVSATIRHRWYIHLNHNIHLTVSSPPSSVVTLTILDPNGNTVARRIQMVRFNDGSKKTNTIQTIDRCAAFITRAINLLINPSIFWTIGWITGATRGAMIKSKIRVAPSVHGSRSHR